MASLSAQALNHFIFLFFSKSDQLSCRDPTRIDLRAKSRPFWPKNKPRNGSVALNLKMVKIDVFLPNHPNPPHILLKFGSAEELLRGLSSGATAGFRFPNWIPAWEGVF